MKVLVACSRNHAESVGTVDAAAAFPWPENSEIRVVSVAEEIQPVMVGLGPDAIDVNSVQLDTNADARKAASDVARQLQSRGLHTEAIVIEGDPGSAIIEQAKEWGADLIVVGSHQHSLIERLLVGSVSDKVVKPAP